MEAHIQRLAAGDYRGTLATSSLWPLADSRWHEVRSIPPLVIKSLTRLSQVEQFTKKRIPVPTLCIDRPVLLRAIEYDEGFPGFADHFRVHRLCVYGWK